jgi:two-component system, OmpR family, response regulator
VLVTVPQATPTEIVLRAGPLELNLLERTAKRGDRQIELLPRELRLLRYMMEHSNQLLARARLMQEAWNYNSFHKQILLTFTWVDFGAE